MKVTAIKQGYHGRLRAVGDVFDVPDGSRASWFVPVDKADDLDKAEKQPTRRKSGADKADDLV